LVVDLLDSTSTIVETTSTTGDGEYQFAALPWNGYTVAIRSDTLPAGTSPTADPDGLASPHTATLVLGCADSSSANAFGYGPAPLPTTPTITVARNPADPGQIDVAYDTATCNASDHSLFFGLFDDFSAVTAVDCSIGNSGSVTSTPPPGNVWLLVAGREGARYSSVGQSTEGERSLEGVAAQCPALLSQDVSASCP
jgi:hypothetical protein